MILIPLHSHTTSSACFASRSYSNPCKCTLREPCALCRSAPGELLVIGQHRGGNVQFRCSAAPRICMHCRILCRCRVQVPRAGAACRCRVQVPRAGAACMCRVHVPRADAVEGARFRRAPVFRQLWRRFSACVRSPPHTEGQASGASDASPQITL
eukprot:IDg22410t1